jgi:two-component system chemotaxis sensor kinase CheA
MSLSHAIEDVIKATTAEAQASHKWKKNVERFDEIYSEWEEYRKIAKALAYVESDGKHAQDSQQGEKLLKELEPKLQLAVEKTSKTLNKRIELTFKWDNIRISGDLKPVVSEILLHLLTNAVDHGIETPDERVDSGKHATGSVVLAARQDQGALLISVSNDGHPLNRGKIAAKALKAGLISPEQAKAYSDQQVFDLIFTDQFSTKEQSNEISGRGVGLSAVRSSVTKLGGEINVRRRPEGRTVFEFTLPQRTKS